MSLVALLSSLYSLMFGQPLLRVAIVDTGLDLNDPRFSSLLCPLSSHDVTGEGIKDINSHGTQVAGILKQHAGSEGYCLIIIKYYSDRDSDKRHLSAFVQGLKLASKEKAQIVNLSTYGFDYSQEEYLELKRHPEITYVMSAGNDGRDLQDASYKPYPISHRLPNIVGVGALNEHGIRRLKGSNYGPNLRWEIGENVTSAAPDNFCLASKPYECKVTSSGTSMATPVITGKLIRDTLINKK